MNNIGIGVFTVLAFSITTSSVSPPTDIQTNSTHIVNYDIDNSSNTHLSDIYAKHNIANYDTNLTNVCHEVSADSINNVTSEYTIREVYVVTNEKQENIVLLESFNNLQDNWDGYNAATPTKELLEFVKGFVKQVNIQPEIFPTPDGGVQLEYTHEKNRHLNIEVLNDKTANVFEMYADGTYTEDVVAFDFQYVNQRISKFYGTV